MAIDKKLQIFDDEGNPVDYDILANDVKFLPDGKDLPTKLAEMEEEIGEGGYTPPQGGIPKTDLAPSVQQTLDDVANKVDKETGKGLSTNDYTTEDKTKLAGLPTGDQLSQQLGGKANDSAVIKSISVNGQTQQKDTNGNVNISVGGEDGEDGITPHIGQNGNWWIGPETDQANDTGMKAQGPKGDTIVGASTTIVNNVNDGGETDALSAEMGKVLRINLMAIYNALGAYAFPEGKPVLNWGSAVINHSINVNGVTGGLTISDVEVDGTSVGSLPSQITDGKSLSLKLNLPSNLYVFDDGVTITMGGVNITNTTGVWDESTGEINIAAVTDEVIITAAALTYVQNGLAFQLDGLNRGDTSGHWKDRIGNIDFTLNNCTENTDNVQFNGSSSYGEAASGVSVDVDATSATIECAYALSAALSVGSFCPMLKNGAGGKAGFCLMNSSSGNAIYAGGETVASAASTVCPILCANSSTAYMKGYASIKIKSSGTLTPEEGGYFNGSRTLQSSEGTGLGVGTTPMRIGRTNTSSYLNGKLFSIRIYSRKLTDAEILQNYTVDQKRFNIL